MSIADKQLIEKRIIKLNKLFELELAENNFEEATELITTILKLYTWLAELDFVSAFSLASWNLVGSRRSLSLAIRKSNNQVGNFYGATTPTKPSGLLDRKNTDFEDSLRYMLHTNGLETIKK